MRRTANAPNCERIPSANIPHRTREVLHGGRTEACGSTRAKDGEDTIQDVDLMNRYPWVCQYFKFPVGHSTIHAGGVRKYFPHVPKRGHHNMLSPQPEICIVPNYLPRAIIGSFCVRRARRRRPERNVVTSRPPRGC
jgi:hypothetical protein